MTPFTFSKLLMQLVTGESQFHELTFHLAFKCHITFLLWYLFLTMIHLSSAWIVQSSSTLQQGVDTSLTCTPRWRLHPSGLYLHQWQLKGKIWKIKADRLTDVYNHLFSPLFVFIFVSVFWRPFCLLIETMKRKKRKMTIWALLDSCCVLDFLNLDFVWLLRKM